MSDFNGPGSYKVIYAKSPAGQPKALDLKDGSRADNTTVQLYDDVENNENQIWHFVSLGHGFNSGFPEYHIINRKSGTFLSAPENDLKGGFVLGRTDSPWWRRTRWNVIPTRNGSGTFLIAPVFDKTLSLNPNHAKTDNFSQVILWDDGPGNNQWYLKQPSSFGGNYPNVPVAPKPKL